MNRYSKLPLDATCQGTAGSAGIPARKLGCAKLERVRAHALMAGRDARAPSISRILLQTALRQLTEAVS
jgi:hypothetical protein